jgi:hypothetical protein
MWSPKKRKKQKEEEEEGCGVGKATVLSPCLLEKKRKKIHKIKKKKKPYRKTL